MVFEQVGPLARSPLVIAMWRDRAEAFAANCDGGEIDWRCIGDHAGPCGRVHDAWARRKLARLFPQLAGVGFEHAWSGRIAMTSDHVPRIVRFGPDALACFGYSGRGIGPGTVFGAAAARALLADEWDALPLVPVGTHDERLTGPRAASFPRTCTNKATTSST